MIELRSHLRDEVTDEVPSSCRAVGRLQEHLAEAAFPLAELLEPMLQATGALRPVASFGIPEGTA